MGLCANTDTSPCNDARLRDGRGRENGRWIGDRDEVVWDTVPAETSEGACRLVRLTSGRTGGGEGGYMSLILNSGHLLCVATGFKDKA